MSAIYTEKAMQKFVAAQSNAQLAWKTSDSQNHLAYGVAVLAEGLELLSKDIMSIHHMVEELQRASRRIHGPR